MQQCQEQLRNAEAMAKQLRDRYESKTTNAILLDTNQELTKQLAAANDTTARLTQEKDALTKDKTDLTSMFSDII